MVDFSLKKPRNNWKNHMRMSNGSNSSNGSNNSKDNGRTGSTINSFSKTSKQSYNSSSGLKVRETNKSKNNNKNNDSKASKKDNIDLFKPYSKLPDVNAHEKNKAASSMHRRLSMYSSKQIPLSTLQQQYSIPLPSLPINNLSQLSFAQSDQITDDNNYIKDKEVMNDTLNEDYLREVIQTKNLRLLLSNENFNAKEFIHSNLSNASATDIDQFTTALNELSDSIQIEVKDNINKSYKEILQVNRDLNLSTKELHRLRGNIQNLNETMDKFVKIADRRIQWGNQRNDNKSISNNMGDDKSTHMLLPPITNINKVIDENNNNIDNMNRDTTNIDVVKKIWNEELINLEKEIEGATNFLVSKNRHLIIKSDDLLELNVTTLRYLQTVRLYIFNDLILVAGKNNNNANKSHYVLKQTFDLKDYSIEQDIRNSNRLIFKTYRTANMISSSATNNNNNNIQVDDNENNEYEQMDNGLNYNDNIISMYESHSLKEVNKIIEAIRRAKDDLCDIFQNELQYEEKLKESFRHLQITQQTPTKDANLSKSPIKNARYSLNSDSVDSKTNDITRFYRISVNNNSIINYNDLITDQQLLQSLTIAMRANMRDSRIGAHSLSHSLYTNQLLTFDNRIEEVDIVIARNKYYDAVSTLMNIKSQLIQLYYKLTEIETNFLTLLMIKINLRCDSIYNKVVNNLTINSTTNTTTANNNNEISQLLKNVETMIELGKAEEGLELFLQNRSNLIQYLILRIGSLDNATNYLTQLSIIRFQIIKQTVSNYKALFNPKNNHFSQHSYKYFNENNEDNDDKNKLKKELSSILVNWCNAEIDKHFQLINEQLLNNEMISPMSIKSSRRQIDELKSVGLDFVYKLDEFIRLNSHRIG